MRDRGSSFGRGRLVVLRAARAEIPPSHIARGDLESRIWSFAISPTTGQIATTNLVGRIALRAQETGWQIARPIDFPGHATAVAFSSDGLSLAVGGNAHNIGLWDVSSLSNEPRETIAVPIERVRCIAFSPDGRYLALAGQSDQRMFLWELATRRVRMVFNLGWPVDAISFSPDGRRLAAGGAMPHQSIVLWDLDTGAREVLPEDGPDGGAAVALAFSPDGAFLASAGFPERFVRLWDLKNRSLSRVLAGHTRSVNSVAFSPDGTLLATAGNDGSLGLWSVATGQRLVSLDSQAFHLKNVAFSGDGGTLILATGDDDDLRSWDLAEVLGAGTESGTVTGGGGNL